MADKGYVQQVELTVDAAPDAVFALLADPHRHPDIDGSGTVRSVQTTQLPLQVGSTFEMHMHHGFSYATRNTVLELDPGRVIAWQTRPLTRPLRWLIGGRIWRYELAPEGSGTRITETWDLRPERKRALVRRLAGNPVADMTATLERLQQVLASGAAGD
ncbi:SRPBCC family protein [Jatrophihabitans endophyticus]|uniref:SRPBCC family protein n=1 Tax=Jatrophihabitans endophyticus TaxID=1206085 RepID=UPI001A02A7F9|nr:SRPBCC family protein [Jatrophihabitans endophyticus]MBE7189335.1 SRPBCC family protein [Jatrophihabitans endophyticus]